MNTNHRIKAVFFDLDGTLRHSVPEGGDVFTDYVRTLGMRITHEDRLRAMRWEHLYWANSVDLRDDLMAHSGETEKFWVEYSRRRLIALGMSPALAREYAPSVSAHMGAEYKPESIIPEDVRNALVQLKESGYRMAVLSNRDESFMQLLDDHKIGEFFDFSIPAGEVQSWKPDPDLFEHALQRAKVTAAEAVYVGDNYFADVVGSRRAGLTPILVDPKGIFPEADCTTIKSFDELISVIKEI
ncbi:MAG TPA: HAD-IA family hydrolase [Anaerolineales bacterium]|nr:HAD-IA family hydrolase [Anaerolineales bacterium]